MKNKLKPFLLLTVITISIFTFASGLFSLTADATYVEGPITQDTTWTLVDSPYVVSKNVIVYSNATLTIESGVEVRFGGNFSIIVAGRLNATGTKDRLITFTSNKEQPEAGNWGTIEFNGTQRSTLTHCTIKYAMNGVTIKNGSVDIRNCQIVLNYHDGITVTNGKADIRNNQISNNSKSGIRLTGDNQVTIQNNNVSSNADGITLTGNSTTGVSISQNTVMLNEQSGIRLNINYYKDVTILNNVLSANFYGFYISSNTSTLVTNNSISYNSIGVYYAKGKNHEAHFNDIYGNDVGMDVSTNATVNAEHNYWGDETGPYHESLNPCGKGNRVGGNGVNLDFISFLTAPIGYINARPTAKLLTDKTLVQPNQTVMFIATASTDDRRVDKYFFDFGDGTTSGWTTLSIFVHEYSSTGTYNAYLTVMDDFGVNSTNTAEVTINVQNLTALKVSFTLPSPFVGYNEQVQITAHVTNGTNAIENAAVTLFSLKGGTFAPSSGLTNSTGYFTTTFTAPNVTEITDILIVATASKDGYADGSYYKYVEVLPPLLVQVTAEPTRIKSEETANITVRVKYSGQPVSEVLVTVASEGGNFTATTQTTDSNGEATFTFQAYQTTTLLNVTITATATKTGYIDGQGQTTLTVEPKVLNVEVTAWSVSLTSEETSQIGVFVTYEGNPVVNATVNISSDSGGNFSATTKTTSLDGYVAFNFTAPLANTPLNATITATAAKIGYVNGEGRVLIAIYPGTLNVRVDAVPATIESRATSTVTVTVTSNGRPVEGATVTVTSDNGVLSATTAVTNATGRCTFILNAPQATTQLSVLITANATKNGYTTASGYTEVTITPETAAEIGGLPLTTILLIVLPIVIVVIVVVLIKFKIIVITMKET